jgi:hypothetical protein
MNGTPSLGGNVGDARLLARLGEMFEETDPVPEAVLAGARQALRWRDPDARLAELVEAEQMIGAAVRAHGDQQLLTFDAPGLSVVVEVTEVGASRRLVGQVVPPVTTHVSVRSGGAGESASADCSLFQVPTDKLGRFTAEAIPPGPLSLRCTLEDGSAVETSWITV